MKTFKKSSLLFLAIASLSLSGCWFEDLIDGFASKKINNAEEFFNAFEGKTIEKTKFRIKQDIDFSNYNDRFPIKCEFNSSEGLIDGEGHSLKGININCSSDDVGIFSTAAIGFENIVIEDAQITITGQHERVGVLGGSLKSGCKNVTVSGTINAENCNYVGGLAGDVYNCLSSSDGCTVNVKVNGYDYVGGMFGKLWFNEQQSNINNSKNGGEVKGHKCVGGLVGFGVCSDYFNRVFYDVTLQNNENIGTVNGAINVGGIFGSFNTEHSDRDGYTRVTLKNCVNKGAIVGTEEAAGGIVGKSRAVSFIDSCSSEANATVTGLNQVGGIAGEAAYVNNCVNKGEVQGSDNVGGVVGQLDIQHKSEIVNNSNEGKVVSKDGCAGGIAGFSNGNLIKGINSTTSTISGCINKGKIVGKVAGGIVGRQSSNKVDNAIGGLLGYDVNRLILKDNLNQGEIDGRDYGGGILGYGDYIDNVSTLKTSNTNEGNVVATFIDDVQINVAGEIYGYAVSDGSKPKN